LDRAGSSVRERAYYVRLDAVSRGPFGSAFLDGNLNDARLDFYEALPTMDPLIVNLHAGLPETRHIADCVDTLIAVLRGYGTLGNCDLNLPKNAGPSAVLRRLLRGLYAVRVPNPPFAVPAPLRLVATIGELRDIGRRFGNCLAQIAQFGTRHWFDLADGSTVYLVADEPRVLIAMDSIGPDLWHIQQMDGPKDAILSGEVRQAMEQKLKEVGVRLVAVTPGNALSNLYHFAKHSKINSDLAYGLDDMLGDFDA
jgi:hypothetical protein